MKVAKLLVNHIQYVDKVLGDNNWNTRCNPIQDRQGNWIVSILEAKYMPKEHYIEIDYDPIIQQEE
jgi:hypothetical protein